MKSTDILIKKLNADNKSARQKHAKKIDAKEKQIREYRKEVSRRASIANKRLKRLEESGMTSSPAYEKWLGEGGEKFSVRGKTYNEVQSELARINNYLDSATSSVSGAKKVVKEMIANTGQEVQFKDWKQLQKESKAFFEIASKVEQYLRTVEDRASSIGYQKIWSAINEYTKKSEMSLDISTNEIERVTSDIVKAMRVWDEKEIKTTVGQVTIWSKLNKS